MDKETKARLDRLIELFSQFSEPMEAALCEIKKSNRSRRAVQATMRITFVSVLACVILVAGLIYYTLDKIADLNDSSLRLVYEVKVLQSSSLKSDKSLSDLIDLAQKNASTPEIANKLEKIQEQIPLPDARTDSASE